MNRNIYKIGALLLSLVLIGACAEFEEFESEDLGNGPSVTVALVSAMDSSITVDVTSSTAGYIASVILPGTGNLIPEDPEVLVLNNMTVNEYYYSESEASTAVAVTFTEGVEQNSTYEIMTVAADDQGVLSVVDVLEVSTTDTHAPGLLGGDPGFTYDPILETDGTIAIVFDEMLVRGTGKFSIESFYTGQMADIADEDVEISGNAVLLTLPFTPLNRDYLWLHWEEGVVTDVAGNGVSALTTYLDMDLGEFIGAFWRVVAAEFSADAISPDVTIAQNPGFDIDIEFAEGVDIADVLDGDITLTYEIDRVSTTYGVLAADISAAGNVLTIAQTDHMAAGGTVTVDIPAGILGIGIGNPNAAITATWDINSVAK